MGNIQSQSTSNPTSIAQKAAVGALRGGQSFIEHMKKELGVRRQAIVQGLNALPGIDCPQPAGAFYAFPNISQILGKSFDGTRLATSMDVANFLLKEANVACVPGEPFGSDSHLRFSYTGTLETIRDGLESMKQALARLS